MQTRREALAQAYNAAVFEVDFPSGPLLFDIETVAAPCAPFFSLSAYNPGFERPSPEVNEQRNAQLERDLIAAGATVLPAVGRDRENTYREPSFAAFGISESTALELARRYDQAAVAHWDGRSFRIIWCD
jgi:hypothetical protein